MNLPRFTVEASGGSPSRKEKHVMEVFYFKLHFGVNLLMDNNGYFLHAAHNYTL